MQIEYQSQSIMHRVLNTIVYILLLLSIAPIAEAKDFVIVIDPGHGGKDAGALGMRTNEKRDRKSVV